MVPMSAVLDGFVPLSKLNAFGDSECGEAVVEFANHNFESAVGFGTDDGVVVDVFVPETLLLLAVRPPLLLPLPLSPPVALPLDNAVVVPPPAFT